MELSSDLIKYGKIYTEVFPDIRLVAPVLGMWDTTVLHEYQFWLATASNNCGEFGLFCDSWGDNGDTAIGSSVIVWNGIRLRDILMNKWRNAPIGGEPRPLFPTENFIPYSTIVKQVKLVRPAKIMSSNLTTGNEAGNTSHWAATEHEGDLFKIAYSMMGFRIILRNIRCNTSGILRREAKFTYELQNIGLTPVYEPWDIYYVFRDRKTNKEITMRKSSFDIRNLMPSDDANDVLQIRSDGWLEIEDEFNDIPRGMYDVYLRISDPDKIVPNMRLSQPGYNENGEYFIDSILI